MEFISSIIGFGAGLGILVFLHELGHFLMAKWCGVRVEQFSIGMPPKIWSKKIGDTEYCLSALPIGGYVKMAGMLDENMDGSVTGASDEFASKNTFQKSLILLGGILFNLLTAVLIFFYFNIRDGETKVLYNHIETIPHHYKVKKYLPEDNISVLSVNGVEIESVNDITTEFINNIGESFPVEYELEDGTRKISIIPENFMIGKGEMFAFQLAIPSKIFVKNIVENSIASQHGFLVGDTIQEIGEYKIGSFYGLTGALNIQKNDSVKIVLNRKGEAIEKSVLLSEQEDGSVKLGVGIGYEIPFSDENLQSLVSHRYMDISTALTEAVSGSYNFFILNMKGIAMMFRGDIDVRENVSGPIGIAKMFGQSIGSMDQFLRTIALFSIVLAFMNLLPIPALDGGHLVVVIIEGIRGKDLSVETKMTLQKIGFVFIMSLMIFAITNDISKLF